MHFYVLFDSTKIRLLIVNDVTWTNCERRSNDANGGPISDPCRPPNERDDRHDEERDRHGDDLVADTRHERHFNLMIQKE